MLIEQSWVFLLALSSFLYVGVLTRAKGVQILAEIAQLISGVENTYLLIQYPGYVKPNSVNMYRTRANELRGVNPKRIILIEDRNRENERPVGYVDLAIHPSLNEVAPRVVKEALVAGVPVLATGCTPFYEELSNLGVRSQWLSVVGLPSYVQQQQGRGSLVLESRDAAATAHVIINKLNSSAPMEDQERSQLRDWARSHFSSDTMLDAFDALYNEFTAEHDRR